MHVNYILHLKWVRRAFQFKYVFHKWLREQWNWKQHLYSYTFRLHTYIHACDEYFGRKEQLVSEEYFA